MNETDLPAWYPSLIEWIRNAGGHVHKSLELRGVGTTAERGIVCNCAIEKGELLILLPSSLSLSGRDMPQTYNNGKRASPWLRCIAALLYQAAVAADSISCSKSKYYTPYLDSLPCQYETLLQWEDDEVTNYLGGTTIGRLLETDRTNKTQETRYWTAVRPYLVESLSIMFSSPCPQNQDDDDEQMERFRQACMCISTRSFHLQSDNDDDDDDALQYSGPFLLPYMDLLNHSPAQSCSTTLKRDAHHNFIMIAERRIEQGEEICHSYGDNLSSCQCLQTFGFVPFESVHGAIILSNGGSSTVKRENPSSNLHVTPAVLSRAEILEACREMVKSGYPQQLKRDMESHHLLYDDDASWDVSIDDDEQRCDFGFVSNELLIPYPTTTTLPLSDELVTLVCLLLLPEDAYQGFMEDSPSLLNVSILQDYFLGKLACRSILLALHNKRRLYPTQATPANLQLLLDKQKKSVTEQRCVYGWTICLEEQASLEALRQQVLEIMDSLDDNA